MRAYTLVDPFSLDLDDVRLPGAGMTFGALPPVGKLIDDLEALGVDVPDAAHWRDLVAATQAPAAPPSAPGLDFTAEQVAAYVRELASHQSTDLVPARQRVAAAIDRAMLTSIRDHADQIIAALKPEFERGVQAIRSALDLGITEDDDQRTMRRASAEVRAAFEALPTVAAHLDEILSVRQRISLWAGAEPNLDGMVPQIVNAYRQGIGPSSIDWTVCITKPDSRVQLSKRDPGRPWLRWLDIVDYLELRTVSELEPEDLLIAAGHDVASLQVAAVQHLEGVETSGGGTAGHGFDAV